MQQLCHRTKTAQSTLGIAGKLAPQYILRPELVHSGNCLHFFGAKSGLVSKGDSGIKAHGRMPRPTGTASRNGLRAC
jgi:hypothetical protein